MLKLALASALLCAFATNAEARQRKVGGLHPMCNITMPCIAPSASTPDQVRVTRGRYIARQVGIGGAIERPAKRRTAKGDWRSGIRQAPVKRERAVQTEVASYGAPSPSLGYTVRNAVSQVIGGRPSGCPHRYCGCGASLHLFGKIVPSLNLAANWLRFPRTAPAPGMVAARRGHVFVLKEHLGGNVWLAHDSNSGRRLTRLHPRSISGYAVVDPRRGAA